MLDITYGRRMNEGSDVAIINDTTWSYLYTWCYMFEKSTRRSGTYDVLRMTTNE